MKCKILIGFYNAATGETVYIAENIAAVVRATGRSMSLYRSVQIAVNKAISDGTTFIFNDVKCYVQLVKEK